MYFICDTETTGLLEPEACDKNFQPYITEIYGCVLDKDFNMITEIDTFVKPPVPIPDFITKITGISDYTVRNAPKFIEIFDELYDVAKQSDVFVAHNAAFDHGVIKHELERHDMEFKFPWWREQICTVEASMPIQNKRLRLTALHQLATGKPHFNGAHRAKPDVMALVRCFIWLKKRGFIK